MGPSLYQYLTFMVTHRHHLSLCNIHLIWCITQCIRMVCVEIWTSLISVGAKAALNMLSPVQTNLKTSRKVLRVLRLRMCRFSVNKWHLELALFQIVVAQTTSQIITLRTKMMKDQRNHWTIKLMKIWISQSIRMTLIRNPMTSNSCSQRLQHQTLWRELYSLKLIKRERKVICLLKTMMGQIQLVTKTGRESILLIQLHWVMRILIEIR